METTQKPFGKSTKYYANLREMLGREPTPQDIQRVKSDLPYKFSASEHEDGERPDDFDFSLETLRKENNLDEEDVQQTFKNYARKLKQTEEERQARNRTIKRTLKSFVVGSLIAVAVGVGGGAGISSYRALKDPILNTRIHNIEKQKQDLENEAKELHNKFYGPLETLTQNNSDVSLTPTERNLYVLAFNEGIARQLFDDGNTFYNKTINGIQITGKKIFKGNSSSSNYYDLAILKKDLKSNAIVSVYLYEADRSTLEELINEAKPSAAIRFDKDFVRNIDFKNKNWLQIKDTKTIYSGSGNNNGMKFYNDESWNILKEFRTLYGRGPNINELGGAPIVEK